MEVMVANAALQSALATEMAFVLAVTIQIGILHTDIAVFAVRSAKTKHVIQMVDV